MDLLGVVHDQLLGVLGVLGSIVNLDGFGTYFHWHFIYISVANLIVIGLMVLVFVLAIALPFPRHRSKRDVDDG
ncbi:MAG TPA: hypothetical protein VGZ03_01755 [Acidimicrobiales bacterium]|jgi:hypothetical protein|nr:hypothetical protein [Acidimicrobiales bacterium]